MTAVSNWRSIALMQAPGLSSCIAVGWRFLLEQKGVALPALFNDPSYQRTRQGGNFSTLRDGICNDLNNTGDVAERLRKAVIHTPSSFPEYLEFIRERVARNEAVLIAIRGRFQLSTAPIVFPNQNGYHIMPVVEVTDDNISMLVYNDRVHEPVTYILTLADFERMFWTRDRDLASLS